MDEEKVKHLEFLQSNIARMNQCSFQMKGWTIGIVSAFLAVYAATIDNGNKGNVLFIFIAIAPTVLFWFLDSYYLQQERKFRGIYNDVAELSSEEERIQVRKFEMPIQKYTTCKYCFHKVIWSRTEWPMYITIIVGLIIAGILCLTL